jgi:F0F1-type ATP synthase membrane subunit b/b'
VDILNQILDYIARTNLFNFIIFAIIIVLIVKKLNVKGKMESAVQEVEETINSSEETRAESEKELSVIEQSMARLSEEVDSIIEQAEENAALVGSKILSDAENSVIQIRQNAQNAIENSKILLKNDIIRRASLASVEVAKTYIIEELKRNSDLHEKLINESIESIEGVEL